MKVKLFISLFAIGLLAFNFSQKKSGEGEKGIALQNVAVMQANAGEMWCDKSDNDPCEISMGDLVGSSRGYLRSTDNN
jgi:hypothetical protein